MIDFGYVNFNNLESEHPDLVPMVLTDDVDGVAWEEFLHSMPQEQLEVLICIYLGLKPAEIVKVLQYQNIARFYNVNAKMRSFYRKQKPRLLAYN